MLLKNVEIIYGKGQTDKFITEHGHTNIDKFARMQAKLKGTDVKEIKITQISA